MLSLTLFGVRFRCHILFPVALLVAAAGGYAREAALLALALAGHELAHLYVAKGVGLPLGAVDIYPYGGVAHISGLDEADAYSETVVAAAGPLSSAALAALSLACRSLSIVDRPLLYFFAETNALLAAVNSLPALPLDGGRIVRAYLARKVGYNAASAILAGWGKAVALGFLLAFGALACCGRFYPAMPVLGLLIWTGARNERTAARFLLLRRSLRKREELVATGLLPVEQLLVIETTPAAKVLRGFLPGRYHILTVVDERLRPVGALAEPQFLDGLIALGGDATLADILRWLGERP